MSKLGKGRAQKTFGAGWARGFAVALSTIWHGWHDGDLVRKTMKEAGVTLEDLERDLKTKTADDYDLAAIREAMGGRDG